MTNDDAEIIGKSVKDIYGSYMGKVVGTITEIDGSIQSVGVDCGSMGLQMIPDEHLVIQGDVVIFIPKWRLDSQKLIREKKLTLRRLRAMIEIVAGNDEMKVDAEIVQERYHAKLVLLQSTAEELNTTLDTRVAELEDQSRSAKMLFFDAKIQYKSNEISEETFETVRLSTGDLIQHVSHEIGEINNIKDRIRGLETEVQEVNELVSGTVDAHISAADYLQKHPAESDTISAMPEALVPGSNRMHEDATTPINERAQGVQYALKQAAEQHPNADTETKPPTVTDTVAADTQPIPPTVTDAASAAAVAMAPDVGDSGMAAGATPGVAPQGGNTDAGAPTTAEAAPGNVSVQSIPEQPEHAMPHAMQEPMAEQAAAQLQHSQQPQQPPHLQNAPSAPSECISAIYPTPSDGSHQDSEIAFPEPPKHSTANNSPPKNDDDWLSRMESQ